MDYFSLCEDALLCKEPFQLLPVVGKVCTLQKWPEIVVTDEVIEELRSLISPTGVMLRLGQRVDKYRLGAMDVDSIDPEIVFRIDDFFDLDAVCGKYGQKGKTIFFLFEDSESLRGKYVFKQRNSSSVAVEFFLKSGYVVLPPSLHPVTEKPYQWIGESLLSVDLLDLPVLDCAKLEHFQRVLDALVYDEKTCEVPKGMIGGSGRFNFFQKEIGFLLAHGFDDASIAKTLVGKDRYLFPGHQFFFSAKLGRNLKSKTDDFINAVSWVLNFKANVARGQTTEESVKILSALKASAQVAECVNFSSEYLFDDILPLNISALNSVVFDPLMIPFEIREYCEENAILSGLNPEHFYLSLLCTFSSVVGARAEIIPKGDFSTYSNISMMICAPSGSRKDAIYSVAMSPIKKLIAHKKSLLSATHSQSIIDLETKLFCQSKIKKKMIEEEASPEDVLAINYRICAMQDELMKKSMESPDFIFESGTQEKLAQMMSVNKKGMLFASSEFVQLFGNLTKKGNESLRGFYLKSLNASPAETATHRTISGLNVEISKMTASCICGIQSDVFAAEIKKMEQGVANDGFYQRFLVMAVSPIPKKMTISNKKIDSTFIDNKFAFMFDQSESIIVTLDAEAIEHYLNFDYALQVRIASDSSALKSFKSKHSSALLKLAYLSAQLTCAQGKIIRVITKSDLEHSAYLLEWNSKMLDITFKYSKYVDAMKYAHLIVDAIRLGSVKDAMPVRHIRSALQAGSTTDIFNALDLLESHNYVKIINETILINKKI